MAFYQLKIRYIFGIVLFNFCSVEGQPVVTIRGSTPAINPKDGFIHSVKGGQIEISCGVENLPPNLNVRKIYSSSILT